MVRQISKGEKVNTISTKGRAAMLKRANANSDSMLMEFIKVNNSEVLKKKEENTKKRIS